MLYILYSSISHVNWWYVRQCRPYMRYLRFTSVFDRGELTYRLRGLPGIISWHEAGCSRRPLSSTVGKLRYPSWLLWCKSNATKWSQSASKISHTSKVRETDGTVVQKVCYIWRIQANRQDGRIQKNTKVSPWIQWAFIIKEVDTGWL